MSTKHDLKTLTNEELSTFQAALENAISWLREFGHTHTIGDYSPLQQDLRSLVRLKNLLIKERMYVHRITQKAKVT